MEPQDNESWCDSDLTFDDDLEALFDIIDAINHNFVVEVEDSIAHSETIPAKLATLH